MAEHTRIARYFAPLAQAEAGSFSLTDDAALLTAPAGKQLVVTTDSVIESIHVLPGATPAQFAQKLLRRNLSDLAAMGATPWRYTLNLHTPVGLAEEWFSAFANTLAAEQKRFGLVLIGGDSTSAANAPIHCTLTCFGLLEGVALRRNGARAGDDLYVSGTLGDAALGLKLLQQNPQHENALTARYHCPEPHLELGGALKEVATAALDISDGLLADIGQLATASSVSARVIREAIPRSPELQHFLDSDPAVWESVLSGGDDYELCFTAPTAARKAIAALAQSLHLPLTRIGEIGAGSGITLVDTEGKLLPITQRGFEHC